MKPPKRERVEKKVIEVDEEVSTKKKRKHFRKWTVVEKKAVLDAIQRYGSDDLRSIIPCVKSRSDAEVEKFVRNVKTHALRQFKNTGQMTEAPSAPIEEWLQLCEEMQSCEVDYSTAISEVLAEAAKQATEVSQKADDPVSWPKLYTYLEKLCSNSALPSVTPTEAAVLLDLFQALADKMMDTSSQRTFLLSQYSSFKSQMSKAHEKIVFEGGDFFVEENQDDPSSSKGKLSSLNPLSIPSDLVNRYQ